MEWYKSFDNVTKLLMMLAGLILIFMEKTDVGITLLAASGALVLSKVADNKKNGNGTAAGMILVFLCLALCFSSCQAVKELPSAVVKANLQVYDVYDQYVSADPNLTEMDKLDLLRTTQLLRPIMLAFQSGISSIDLLMLPPLPPPPEINKEK